MPRLQHPSAGIRVLHIGPRRGPHRRAIETLQERDHDNEHLFLERFSDRVRSRSAGKNAVGVIDRTVAVARRVQMERADIAKQVRLTDPDIVAFHNDELARLGVIALHGARAWMVGHRYASAAIPRGVIKRMAYARVSMWVVPDNRGKTVVQAVGIEEARIKVVRPFFKPVRTTQRAPARQKLGLPNKTTIGVVEPGPAELSAIRPVLTAMREYDQGYTLAIVDPEEEILSAAQALAAQTSGQAVVITREAQEDVFGALDATVNLNWDDNVCVDEQSVNGMLAAREVIALNSINANEHVGDDLIKVSGTKATQILPVLQNYTPDPVRQQRLKSRAQSRFGMQNMVTQLTEYKDYAAMRSRTRSRLSWLPNGLTAGVWTPDGITPSDSIWLPDGDGGGEWASGSPGSRSLNVHWVPDDLGDLTSGAWEPKAHIAAPAPV